MYRAWNVRGGTSFVNPGKKGPDGYCRTGGFCMMAWCGEIVADALRVLPSRFHPIPPLNSSHTYISLSERKRSHGDEELLGPELNRLLLHSFLISQVVADAH
jgi:hypothetical protein